MSRETDYYAVLGVSPGSQDVVVDAAYRALMQKYDPQVAPSVNAAKKRADLNAAYAVLGDPQSRADYDKRRGYSATEPVAPPTPPSAKSEASTGSSPSPPEPEEHAGVAPKSGLSGGQTAFLAIAGFILLIVVISSASFSPDGTSAANNVLNVDENLTTTDMNATSSDTETNVASIEPKKQPTPYYENKTQAPAAEPPPMDSDSSDVTPVVHGATRAEMSADIRTLFSADDYPASAQAAGVQGTAQATVTVGADGRVWNCSIIQSTGNSSLDYATCDVIRRRAKFTPARDASGNPTTDTFTTPPITWKLED